MDPPRARYHLSPQAREAAIQQIHLYGRHDSVGSPGRGPSPVLDSFIPATGRPNLIPNPNPSPSPSPSPILNRNLSPERIPAYVPAFPSPEGGGKGYVAASLAREPEVAFFNPAEPPPPVSLPPRNYELQKRIDRMVEYAAKSGPEFEMMIRDRQRYNPAYDFLFGGEGYAYYRYRLWINVSPLHNNNTTTSSSSSAFSSPPPPLFSSHTWNNASESTIVPPLAKQPRMQAYVEPSRPPLENNLVANPVVKAVRGFSGPLPAEIAAELHGVLQNLSGSKDSIKGAKSWFVKRSLFAPTLAVAMRDRLLSLDDVDRQLHVVYLANDILFDSLKRRSIQDELDKEALAFQPVLGCMLAAIYHNPQSQEANQARLRKILQFWVSHKVYSADIIESLEREMLAQPASPQGKRPFSPVEEDDDNISPRETYDGHSNGRNSEDYL